MKVLRHYKRRDGWVRVSVAHHTEGVWVGVILSRLFIHRPGIDLMRKTIRREYFDLDSIELERVRLAKLEMQPEAKAALGLLDEIEQEMQEADEPVYVDSDGQARLL